MAFETQDSSRHKETARLKNQEFLEFLKLKLCFPQSLLKGVPFLFLVVTICFIFCVDRRLRDSLERRFGVIIDAGSSGTRVHVCSFSLQNGDNLILEKDHYLEAKHSLTVCFQNASRVANLGFIFSKLLNFVRDIVPEPERPRTPIFLKATAGLRLMHGDIVEAVLDATRGILIASEFSFEPSRAIVMDGSDEALYGGGSFQVAFDTNSSLNDQSIRNIPVLDKTYHVYSQSFLGMGLVEFRRRLYKFLKERDQLTSNPCFYKGVTDVIDVDGREQSFVETSGMGSFESCVALISDVFVEEFHFSVGEFRNRWNTKSSLSDLEEMGRYICSEEWNVVQNTYTSTVWFLQSYQGSEFGWSLGALVHEMNLLLHEKQVL
ncbi:Probable apyrase 5 [Galdieria sulphuraria]|nr:Probable apyrase 5 [Galdieria sulphuraria]